MNLKYQLALSLALFLIFGLNAQTKHANTSRFPSYKGLIMAGYQGWFRAPGDGSGSEWAHYRNKGKFDKNDNDIDFWPDVTKKNKINYIR